MSAGRDESFHAEATAWVRLNSTPEGRFLRAEAGGLRGFARSSGWLRSAQMSSVRNPLACFVLTLGAVVAALAGWAPAAWADWSAPQVVASAPPLHLGSGYVSAIVGSVAVDSRGDVAVAWSRTGARPAEYQGRRCSWEPEPPKRLGCYPVTTVHLTVVMASGRTVTRVVTSARAEQLDGVVLSPAEATVLLGYTNPRVDSPGGLRVAYGPLIGRWSAPQTISGRWSIGWTNERPEAQPHLALSPDGTVLVAWNGCLTQHACDGIIGEGYAEQRVVVAWHRPGRPFGPPTVVRAAPLGSLPQFDAAGTAYLSGKCSGTVAMAPAHSRRFSRTIVTRGAAKSFTLALSGARQGLAAWVAGACSYVETTPPQNGAVLVSLLRASGFVTPFALTAAPAESADAVASPTSVTVSWDVRAANGIEEPFSAQIDANGLPGATQQGANAVIPITADGRGDVLLRGGRAANTYGPGAPGPGPLADKLFVRPAGGGPDQPAPAPSFGEAAAAPAGRTIALIWSPDMTKLDLSIWRP